METATALSIERALRRAWGEAAVLHPEAFEQALVVEVRKVGGDGRPQRAVIVAGTLGPQVSERDYFPIHCCRSDVAGEKHEVSCRYQGLSLAALDATGGVMTYPPGAEA